MSQCGNGIDQCDCCGRDLNPGRIVWLEFDQRISAHHDYCLGVPEQHSQGWFPFGPACAARKLREARESAKRCGVHLGRRRISKVERAIRTNELRKILGSRN